MRVREMPAPQTTVHDRIERIVASIRWRADFDADYAAQEGKLPDARFARYERVNSRLWQNIRALETTLRATRHPLVSSDDVSALRDAEALGGCFLEYSISVLLHLMRPAEYPLETVSHFCPDNHE